MLTQLLRLALARRRRPFRLSAGASGPLDLDSPRLGLYVHVPFCRTLCDFCPYAKTVLQPGSLDQYGPALLEEIALATAGAPVRPVTSVYFGGGTPALAVAWLPRVLDALRARFRLAGQVGIELHPNGVDAALLRELRGCGFDMVSLGIQSFQPAQLQELGRPPLDGVEALRRAQEAGFAAIDVDLIFGLPGQTEASLLLDFETAARHGATQVSTYPFIPFSYTRVRRQAPGRRRRRALLEALLRRASALGFERTSVWTFARPHTARYSSITRDSFRGFGPSAASLLRNRFQVNTFSVPEYVRAVGAGRLPIALSLDFDLRGRALYWLFWSAYQLRLDAAAFSELFGVELKRFFGWELALGCRLGILRQTADGYALTDRGASLFHLVEQEYTHEYIDRAWRLGQTEAWPQGVELS